MSHKPKENHRAHRDSGQIGKEQQEGSSRELGQMMSQQDAARR